MKSLLKLATSLIVLTGVMVTSGSILRADIALAGEADAVGNISDRFSATGNNRTATSNVVAFGSFGGKAGAAGSISAQFSATGNNLTATAGAVAVGKTGAFTTARTNATEISAVAAGYAGQMNVVNINGAANYSLTAETAIELAEVQGNSFTSAPTLNLLPGATTGVTLP
jgi:hypothetical protein